MRELALHEQAAVAGGGDLSCGPEDGNNFGGITDSGSVGSDLVNIYEGLVFFTSHVIERVANAL